MTLAFCIALFVAALEFLYIVIHPCASATEPEHECTLEITAAQPMVLQDHNYGFPVGKPEPVTQVLRRCVDCGEVSTETLHGVFTLAQLKGEAEPETSQAGDALRDAAAKVADDRKEAANG